MKILKWQDLKEGEYYRILKAHDNHEKSEDNVGIFYKEGARVGDKFTRVDMIFTIFSSDDGRPLGHTGKNTFDEFRIATKKEISKFKAKHICDNL